jgi:aminoglycoside phosphotransferase (APT) family kinase protein
VLATAHDMAREHRIVSAVGPTAVPVAPTFGLCTDDEVNGAPFYVMGFVDGVVLDSPAKAEAMTAEARHAAALRLIDVLAALHDVDVDAVGLGDLARRDGYIDRQLRRWGKQWDASKTRELPAIEEVQRRLEANVPVQQGTAIVHGDYRFGNCLVDPATGYSRRCSTGSCAPSATRWPTSGTSRCTGPTRVRWPGGPTTPLRRAGSRRWLT